MGGFEGAGESVVIGLDGLAAHVREVEDGGVEMTVSDKAGNEGGPGDDRASVGGAEGENELGRVQEIEFRVHVDEVVGEKGWDDGGIGGPDDLGMYGSAE